MAWCATCRRARQPRAGRRAARAAGCGGGRPAPSAAPPVAAPAPAPPSAPPSAAGACTTFGRARFCITPAARRRAAALGLSLEGLRGTGGRARSASPTCRRRRRAAAGASTRSDAQGDRRGDGPLQARDPALLSQPDRGPHARAGTAGASECRAHAARTAIARGGDAARSRPRRGRDTRAERLLGK